MQSQKNIAKPAHYPWLENFWHFGYLTTDIDRALEIFAVRLGLDRINHLPGFEVQTAPGRWGCIDIAVGFAGDTMVELIRPKSGELGVFNGPTSSKEFELSLHHLAYRVPSEQEWHHCLNAVAASGFKIAKEWDRDSPIHSIYLDFKETLGHYLQYQYLPE